MKKFLYFSAFLFILFFIPQTGAASPKTIVINELMWGGSTKSTADEWVELRNLANQDIDISGWQIQGAATSNGILTIPDGKTIKADSYFLISNYSKTSSSTILNIESDWVTTSISLANDNPKYFLRDKNGTLIDEIEKDNGEPLAGDNNLKYSMERTDSPADGTKSKDWHTATLALGLKSGSTEKATPGFANSPPFYFSISKIKTAKSQPESKISGVVTVLPELFFEKRLYIQDETAGVRLKLDYDEWPKVEIGTRIAAKGKFKTYYTEKELEITDSSEVEIGTKETINPFSIKTGEISFREGDLVRISGTISETSGDTFYVDDGSGPAKIYVKDETGIKLPDKHKGDRAEIIGIVNNWSGNFRILPRMQSDIVITYQNTSKEVKDLPISEARKQPKGTRVRVRGVVSVTPGIISKSYFYVQDDTAGIQIYCYYKRFPNLKLGDFIEVTGEISESFGEKRIKIVNASDIIILGSRAPPAPKSVKIKNIANFEGMLVRVRGTVIKTSGNTFYIDDGTGEIKIVIQKLIGIKKPRLKKGDIVEIVGIVSKTKTGYRILPRYQKDFRLVWTKPKAQKKSKIKGTSVANAASLNDPKVIFESKKEPVESFLNILGWVLIIGSLGVIVYLKRMKMKDKNIF